ncbi:hypothetical protein GUJ93_ZPchr0012g20941 [Zizania palustris]|uniref:Uncharacterized protein n=1 Tax=Zizania palustris TaxID=103762 RepID=A0A8J5WRE7_ZIZPA|nr:hypothetical protein GUJ93_ZPchr0012g20941 [Zizania palustris]
MLLLFSGAPHRVPAPRSGPRAVHCALTLRFVPRSSASISGRAAEAATPCSNSNSLNGDLAQSRVEKACRSRRGMKGEGRERRGRERLGLIGEK